MIYTHYSYLCCPIGYPREPTGLYNLSDCDEVGRRKLIWQLGFNGEYLARVPFASAVADIYQLRKMLQWTYDNKRRP